MTKRAEPEEIKNVLQNEVTLSMSKAFVYNIGKWTEEEHQRFLKAIEVYGNQWKKVRDCVGTRSCAQIRSHCQKYFRRKRNMMLQELRRTNSHKGMRFLVVKEYYNYTGPNNKSAELSNALDINSVEEDVKEETVKELEVILPSTENLIKIEEPQEEAEYSLIGLDGIENSINEEGHSNGFNYLEPEFLLDGSLYEHDNELTLNNQFDKLVEY